ncbi:MAG TPA: MoaD/ThiS family protein [Thermopetrobacter sp.]|nr:MoaD/ThiS family protein [Thermopetrobacter sp.]
MRITLKLFATLEKYLPAARDAHNAARVEVADGASVAEVLRGFGVPPEEVHLVLLDGRFVPPDTLEDVRLEEGRTLAVWPPVAGG